MKLLALGLALSLAACASPRGPQVAYHGALQPGSGTYSFAGGDRQPERAEIEAAVGRQLAADGYRQVEHSPDYVVEVLFSARPAKVGAYEKLAAETPEWKVAPVKTPWWRLRKPTVGEVTIRFVEARSGFETYRATATTGRTDMGKTAAQAAAKFDELAQAAARPPVT